MSAAIVLAIVVATQNADDQATEAMRSTAAEAIGDEDAVIVREAVVPSDDEVLRIERLVHARNVAEVVWLDAANTHARVRVHMAEGDRWTERTITFSTVDTSVERGRALGFAVTSMLPDEVLSARPHLASARGSRPGSGQTDEPENLRTALRLSGIGSTGLGGTAAGMGGALAGEFFTSSDLSFRMGVGLRQGAVPPLQGTDLAFSVGAGGAYWFLPPAHGRRVAVGVRADALALYHRVTDNRRETLTARRSKWLPGLDVLGEAALSLAAALDLVGSLGIEAAFGRTALWGDDMSSTSVGTVPFFRGVAEIGIRLSF